MANAKKQRRQLRALERLENRIEIDGLGFARSSHISGNTTQQEVEHHQLRKKLDMFPKCEPRIHPSDSRNRLRSFFS